MRLLAFNLLLLFLPMASLLYLDSYEKQLLETQEGSMIQQGRLLASALDGQDLAAQAAGILRRLAGRVDSRLRVIDAEGRLLADSATLSRPAPASAAAVAATASAAAAGAAAAADAGGQNEQQATPPDQDEGELGIYGSGRLESLTEAAKAMDAIVASPRANEHPLYRIVVYPLNALRRLFLPPQAEYNNADFYSGATLFLGPEVRSALAGRYGAITRLSTGGQVSVNLYSAIPIFGEAPGQVRGVVLVSRSTYGILVRLYVLRLDIIRIFVVSLLASLVLSVLLALTITVPIGRLKAEAETALDGSGRLRGRFTGLKRKDEIGDLSRALAALADRLKKRIAYIDGFTADLMHELKNPLAAIRGAAELAISSPSKEEGLLTGIRDEELRMERLLAGLREISGIDNRMEGERADTIDLAAFLPGILGRYPHQDYPSVRVGFVSGAEGPALVRMNADRLVQLIVNPVDNAVSFSPPGSRVTVSLEEAGRDYRVSIRDEGPGFPPGMEERLFERFYSDRPESDAQDGAARSGAKGHSGLGLAIVKAIAEGYGGSCSIANVPGGGCILRIELPRLA
jgi:two-component system sensor histidine kinase ChvG